MWNGVGGDHLIVTHISARGLPMLGATCSAKDVAATWQRHVVCMHVEIDRALAHCTSHFCFVVCM